MVLLQPFRINVAFPLLDFFLVPSSFCFFSFSCQHFQGQSKNEQEGFQVSKCIEYLILTRNMYSLAMSMRLLKALAGENGFNMFELTSHKFNPCTSRPCNAWQHGTICFSISFSGVENVGSQSSPKIAFGEPGIWRSAVSGPITLHLRNWWDFNVHEKYPTSGGNWGLDKPAKTLAMAVAHATASGLWFSWSRHRARTRHQVGLGSHQPAALTSWYLGMGVLLAIKKRSLLYLAAIRRCSSSSSRNCLPVPELDMVCVEDLKSWRNVFLPLRLSSAMSHKSTNISFATTCWLYAMKWTTPITIFCFQKFGGSKPRVSSH